MNLREIKTPALVLDVARVRRNARRMAERAKELGASLRPHVKTHKCVEVARLQTEGHDGGLTVSTLAEARAFLAHGFKDITYAVPVEPDRPEALEIPRLINDAPNLRFAGILTHAGHSYHARSRGELLDVARRERDVMTEFAARLRADGVEVPTVSVGSTPTITQVDHLDGVDEARPGNYIFFDAFQATLGSCAFDDCALTVLAAVVHRDRARRKLVLDAGAIALSKDRGAHDLDASCGFGRVLDLGGRDTGLRVGSLSQEHGAVHVHDDALLERLPVGTRVRVLANHSCLTAAQHSHYHVLEGDALVDRWEIHRGW